MTATEKYSFWLTAECFDQATKDELLAIKDNPKEIEERFYKDLEFGTGGLRGIMGAGTNRMNTYTIRKTSQGIANYVSQKGASAKNQGIVIAYDPRRNSREFAFEAAKVFAGNGIKVYIFDELHPTPLLSFSVRNLKTAAGVVVTASHNPKEYNGYKVYGPDGSQLSVDDSEIALAEIDKVQDFSKIVVANKEEAIASGMIEIIGEKVDAAYIEAMKTLRVNPDVASKVGDSLNIIYTPIHGSGNKPVRRLLKECGFTNVAVVKEQELPDSEFSTVKSPNPEDFNAFKIAIEMAKASGAELLIGTDPDSDRLGVVIKNPAGEFIPLTGNQIGCILMDYVLTGHKSNGTLPQNPFVIRSIVSSKMVDAIAKRQGVELVEVLTGFKFFGEQIKLRDEFGPQKYVFGFEESFGYLPGSFVRDKDAVASSMLFCEAAAYYKSRGMSVYDGLMEMYQKYGYYIEDAASFTIEGIEGVEIISSAMAALREKTVPNFGDVKVSLVRDLVKGTECNPITGKTSDLSFSKSNVLYYETEDGSWFCVRPSGTEPKIKLYFGVVENTRETAEAKLQKLKASVLEPVKKLLQHS